MSHGMRICVARNFRAGWMFCRVYAHAFSVCTYIFHIRGRARAFGLVCVGSPLVSRVCARGHTPLTRACVGIACSWAWLTACLRTSHSRTRCAGHGAQRSSSARAASRVRRDSVSLFVFCVVCVCVCVCVCVRVRAACVCGEGRACGGVGARALLSAHDDWPSAAVCPRTGAHHRPERVLLPQERRAHRDQH